MILNSVYLTRRAGAGIRRPRRWVPRTRCDYLLHTNGWTWLVRCVPFIGRSVVGVRVRGSTHPFEPMPFLWEDLVKQRVVKSGAGATGGPVHLAAVESVLFAKLPRIVEHLVTTRYADGSPRRPGLLMLNVLGAAWQVRVTEPDVSAKLTCVAETLDDALALVELHLGSEDAPWEVDAYAQASKKKK